MCRKKQSTDLTSQEEHNQLETLPSQPPPKPKTNLNISKSSDKAKAKAKSGNKGVVKDKGSGNDSDRPSAARELGVQKTCQILQVSCAARKSYDALFYKPSLRVYWKKGGKKERNVSRQEIRTRQSTVTTCALHVTAWALNQANVPEVLAWTASFVLWMLKTDRGYRKGKKSHWPSTFLSFPFCCVNILIFDNRSSFPGFLVWNPPTKKPPHRGGVSKIQFKR